MKLTRSCNDERGMFLCEQIDVPADSVIGQVFTAQEVITRVTFEYGDRHKVIFERVQ